MDSIIFLFLYFAAKEKRELQGKRKIVSFGTLLGSMETQTTQLFLDKKKRSVVVYEIHTHKPGGAEREREARETIKNFNCLR